MFSDEFDSYGKPVLKNKLATKDRAFPSSDKPTWGTNRGQNFKRIKARRTKLSEELSITDLPFCFLKAKNITTSFSKSILDWVPFFIRIDTSDIPAEDFPTSMVLVIHDLQLWEESTSNIHAMVKIELEKPWAARNLNLKATSRCTI